DGQLELGAVHAVHREAGAVNRDRALEGDVPGQLARRADAKLHGAGIVFAADDLTHAIHVPADQMTAQPTGGRQGLFQVHPTAALQVGEAGARQGLATDVGPEAVTGQLDGGQTDAVDGDAVAELHVTEIQLAGPDVDADVAALGGDGLNRSEEHTSELQSRENLVCRLLLEKK